MKHKIKIGFRSSPLSQIQSKGVVEELSKRFPWIEWETKTFESPGDRDRTVSLMEVLPDDFFTQDLDQALLNKEIDLAIHSAKDCPIYSDKLTNFWWPDSEDSRDVLVFRHNFSQEKEQVHCVGSSSKRRSEYAEKRFPKAKIKSIRGNIEDRIEQLDRGEYDVLILAAAGLKRLGFNKRINEYISFEELSPPPGQGVLNLVYLSEHTLLNHLRSHFIFPITIAGAGPGQENYLTLGVFKKIKTAQCCLFDALVNTRILDHLPPNCEKIYVGKRGHDSKSTSQDEILSLMKNKTLMGKRVLRLKGGDPGIFGRLDEERDFLRQEKIPFVLFPGISAFQLLPQLGLSLTSRDDNKHFLISSLTGKDSLPDARLIKELDESEVSRVYYMGVKHSRSLAKTMTEKGLSQKSQMVYATRLGGQDEGMEIISLQELAIKPLEKSPGLIFKPPQNISIRSSFYGPLLGKKIWLTGTPVLSEKASQILFSWGADPIDLELNQPVLREDAFKEFGELKEYDFIIFTSRNSVILFLRVLKEKKVDLRTLPKLIVLGKHTGEELEKVGVFDFATPTVSSREGLMNWLINKKLKGKKYLVPSSELSPPYIHQFLQKEGAISNWVRLYSMKKGEVKKISNVDGALWFSSSGVHSFKQLYLEETLPAVNVCLGSSTSKTFEEVFKKKFYLAEDHSIEAMIKVLQRELFRNYLNNKNEQERKLL